jgi:phosphatidylinositol alpha-1,6-mannosyltransferase
LADDAAYTRVVALPRVLFEKEPAVPQNLDFRQRSAGGKVRYIIESLKAVARERFDVVICSHINLLPIAAAAAAAQRVPLLLVVYGIEAWKPPRGLAAKLVKKASAVVAISEYTKRRFLEWSGVESSRVHVIPCCVNMKRFVVGPKRDDLLRKYGLCGRTVMLTVARLAGQERAKGIDEVMESLTNIAREIPNISYLIVGDGSDRERLEEKAASLGLSNRVVFAGFVAEEDKVDHYRLADAYVMPGRGEGFGIVYLEALACGVPIIASSLDASAEVVLNRSFGRVVNPDRPAELKAACVDVLAENEGIREVPRELAMFSFARFKARWNWLFTEMRVGDLAAHPPLVREPVFGSGWGAGGVYAPEIAAPNPTTSPTIKR